MGAIADTVNADGARLQQVVWNLLTNAIKFTPKGGQIQVLLQRVNSHLELSVSDNGIGIAADYLPQVFDRFSQHESSAPAPSAPRAGTCNLQTAGGAARRHYPGRESG